MVLVVLCKVLVRKRLGQVVEQAHTHSRASWRHGRYEQRGSRSQQQDEGAQPHRKGNVARAIGDATSRMQVWSCYTNGIDMGPYGNTYDLWDPTLLLVGGIGSLNLAIGLGISPYALAGGEGEAVRRGAYTCASED